MIYTDVPALPDLSDYDCLSTYLLLLAGGGSSAAGPPTNGGLVPCADSILQENGDYILQESGAYICQEGGTVGVPILWGSGFYLPQSDPDYRTCYVATGNASQQLGNGDYVRFYGTTIQDFDITALRTGGHNVRLWFQVADPNFSGNPSITLILNANQLNITNLVSGSVTAPASIADGPLAFENGDLFEYRRISNTEDRIYQNGALIYTFDASAVPFNPPQIQMRFMFARTNSTGEGEQVNYFDALNTALVPIFYNV